MNSAQEARADFHDPHREGKAFHQHPHDQPARLVFHLRAEEQKLPPEGLEAGNQEARPAGD